MKQISPQMMRAERQYRPEYTTFTLPGLILFPGSFITLFLVVLMAAASLALAALTLLMVVAGALSAVGIVRLAAYRLP